MSNNVDRMKDLFSGFEDAYGTHGTTDKNNNKGGKQEIKKTARTIRSLVTRSVWAKHLSGEEPLGIIPIKEDNTCVWGCVDIDRYDINHGEVVAEVEKRGLPLVICKTKSGGAHAYLFLKNAVPASEIRETLKDIAATMGWADCEIFPKQNQVLIERGDLGNWLNMPYLGGDDTERYCVKKSGLAMTLDEFLSFGESSRVDLTDIRIKKPKAIKKTASGESKEVLGDGPPCLQHLSVQGFPEGTRNNGLFALGIYCKKKYGENWKEHLEEMNRNFMSPPLTSDEVMGVIRNLEKSDYKYSCKEVPFCNHCEVSLCRSRKFGIQGTGIYPEISSISKLDVDPPIWFVDIEDNRVELTTKDLHSYAAFQLICLEQLSIAFSPVKTADWISMLHERLQDLVVIEVPEEMSTNGHFMELLESFVMDRHKAERWEDIHQGRPYHDPETNMHWFRLRDLMGLLEQQSFKVWGRNKVGKELKDIGMYKGRNIDGKFVNLFAVPNEIFQKTPDSHIPDIKREPI